MNAIVLHQEYRCRQEASLDFNMRGPNGAHELRRRCPEFVIPC